MALFEVYIPGKDAGTPNVTLKVEAPNWIGALRSGLKTIGEGQEAIANVMCDIKEDNSIHVTDVATRRVFRLRETPKDPATIPEGPRPISMPDGAPFDGDTVKNERPGPGALSSSSMDSPKTLIEFPLSKLDSMTPPPDRPLPASLSGPSPVSPSSTVPPPESTVKWAVMPPPSATNIPDPRTIMPGAPFDSGPPPDSTVKWAVMPSPGIPDPRAMISPISPSTAVTTPQVPITASAQGDPDTIRTEPMRPVAAVPDKPDKTEKVPRPRFGDAPVAVKPASGPPTPRGVPAPAPKRPSGQFAQAPEPRSRETTKPNKATDPKIGRVERTNEKKERSVQDAIAAVFDATQDLYMDGTLSAQKVADKLLDIALAHIPADAGTFYLADVNGHELTFAAVRGPKAEALKRSGMTVPVGQGIIGFCAQEGVCLAVNDIQKDPRFLASIAKSIDYQPKDTLCASSEKEGRLWGALQLINSTDGFDAAHMEVLRFIGLTAASILERVAERE